MGETMVSFDSMKFLTENFPDRGKIRGRLREVGVGILPDDETIRKWFKREKVSDGQVLNLLFCLEQERGGPVSLAPYFKE